MLKTRRAVLHRCRRKALPASWVMLRYVSEGVACLSCPRGSHVTDFEAAAAFHTRAAAMKEQTVFARAESNRMIGPSRDE